MRKKIDISSLDSRSVETPTLLDAAYTEILTVAQKRKYRVLDVKAAKDVSLFWLPEKPTAENQLSELLGPEALKLLD